VELTRLLRNSVFAAAFAVSVVGCQDAADECASLDCAEASIVASLDQDDAATLTAVERIDDALVRIGAMSAAIGERPSKAERLCERFPHGIGKSRCESIAKRPHLWAVAKEASGPTVRAGRGPARSGWANEDVPVSDWKRIKGETKSCSGDVDPAACAWGNARRQARAGDGASAARWCAVMPGQARMKNDCFVQSAEWLTSRWGRARLESAFELCGAAGEFRGMCGERVVASLAAKAPSSAEGGAVAWAPHLMRLRALRSVFDEASAQRRVEDRFWALSAWAAVTKAPGLSGDAMDAWPPNVAAHLRAAITHRLITSRSEAMSLEDAVRLVETVLARRMDSPPEERGEQPAGLVKDLWPHDRDGESHLAAVSYLGHSRRTVAKDPIADAAICVLEAAARAEPPWQTVLEEAKSHSDERVRWTAVRLVEQLAAQRLGTEAAQWTPTPGEPTPSL
jgi:hypothetical protein